ncbi:MAG: EAL domain-containing protein [Acaryochloridaceae cyanobacterium RU_4_10]|nr:EAL domain-containing protein [Acaryochloridaceae cyanobacterium RU_4_10]
MAEHSLGEFKGNILIVDDKADNLRILSSLLSDKGYKVRAVLNGASALRAAQSTPPDVILLDVLMPEMDGYQVCQRLKQDEVTGDIPVIFLSALDESMDKVKAFEAGGLDYITKPFQGEEVLVRVETQLRLRLAQREIQTLNQSLEERVRERTRQLEATNQHLQQEISERSKAEQQLRHMVMHDSLTSLNNREHFMRYMQELLTQLQDQPDRQFALLFLDCDGFKVVNDSLGHLVGDQLLIAIARKLEQCLDPGQMLIRLGGDEFLILVSELSFPQNATIIADRVLEAYVAPFYVEQQEIFINVSIGIVIGNGVYQKPEHVLRDADIAMYKAKALGKGAYQIFSPEMYEQALERMKIENSLRRAIERDELLLYYQPIVSLASGIISGFEALIRWQHPEWGLVNPQDFIGIAEETGLIIPIGKWVLQTACTQMNRWEQFVRHPLFISVNLSMKQLYHPLLVEDVDAILQSTKVRCDLTLELTESMMMRDVEAVKLILTQLKARSIHLSIDDFGQGYSSLSYLHDLPVDAIKIDRAFVSGNHSPNPDADLSRPEIVRTIIDLAHNLGVKVVAEGIETQAQLDRLKQLDCEWGQGYFFSKPMNCVDVDNFLLTGLQHLS